jgi:hypothetical protein
LDFTNKGEFEGAPAVPLVDERTRGSSNGQIGPAVIQVVRNGKTIPVTVSGSYQKSASYRHLTLDMGTALEGTCQFGKKTYPLRIIDGNNNLRCGDVVTSGPQAFMGKVAGDSLAIDTGDGKFKTSVRKSYYGQPALVDGVWYDVAISTDGTKVTAEPAKIESAKLKIAHDEWRIRLAGAKYVLTLSGSGDPVEIPADHYVVLEFRQSVKDETPRGAALTSGGKGGKAARFKAPPGETTELAIGAPLTASITLTASIKAKTHGRAVSMDFKLTDASGAEATVAPNKGGRPTPKVEVLDSEGKRVHSGNFEYG